MRPLTMLRMSSWRQKVFRRSLKKVFVVIILILIFNKIIFVPFRLSLAGCEATEEVPPSSLGLEQGVPVVDPEVGATSTSFGVAEMKPPDEIVSSASSIRQSLLTIPPMKHDRGSQPMEWGETLSRPSL